MKVAIVTFVRAYNYGAVLQAYALNKVINDMGIECQVIDYFPPYFFNQYYLTYYGRFIKRPSRNIVFWVKNNILFSKVKKRGRCFDRFIRREIVLTDKQFHNIDEIKKDLEKFDIYLSGSDQVWNPELSNFDETFFLSFCELGKRCSYSASFGFDVVPGKYEQLLKNKLLGWKNYSVRERSGVNIIYNLIREKATCDCDPTLLISSEHWNRLASKTKCKKNYILLYFVNAPSKLLYTAKKLSEKTGLSVICLSTIMHPKGFNGELLYGYNFINKCCASPYEFLSLFKNASYILTNSFHGTVFSVVFQRQFLTEVNLSNGEGVNRRTKNLLNDLGLANRELAESEILEIDKPIKWEFVNNELSKIKEQSLNNLKNILHY